MSEFNEGKDNWMTLHNQLQSVNRSVASTVSGEYVSERNQRRTFSALLGIIGSQHYTMHLLRHTFASRLLDRGIEVTAVSKLLGHADINTTYKTYIHVTRKQVKSTLLGISQV